MAAVPIPTGPTVPRSSYIGGSQVAAVVGLNPWMSQLDVWAEVTGRSSEPVTFPMELGLAFERPALGVYSRRYGRRITFPGTLVDPQAPHRGATPDGIEDERFDVQVKLVGRTVASWGDPVRGAAAVPDYVVLQAQWEMRAIRAALGLVCPAARVLKLHGTQHDVYTVPYDAELVSWLTEAVDRFWRDHIVVDRMPQVTEIDEEILARLLPREREPLQVAPPEVDELLREYAAADRATKTSKARKDLIKNQLRLAAGVSRGFTSPYGRVTCATEKGAVSWKAVAAALGATDELIEQHRGEPKRTLRVRATTA